MSQHFKSYAAVLPVILRKREGREEVLLHRRTFLLSRTGVPYSEILYHTPEEEETL